ncbi:MAG: recombination protein RmuC [Bacteroidota bacterium]|jgi:DNA recombination protein RmuC
MEIVYLLVGVVLGAVLTYMWRQNYWRLEVEKSVAQHPLMIELRDNRSRIQQELEVERKQRLGLTSEVATLREKNQALLERQEAYQNDLVELKKQFHAEFNHLANRIFDEKSSKFNEQNKQQLDAVLHPLKDKLREFETKVERIYGEENKDRGALKTEIKMLTELNNRVSHEAQQLVTALRGNKQQGNWGEMILENVLDRSGLTKGQEYLTQVNLENAEGLQIKPDVVIQLPENKHIIIDAKVSLVAYNAMIATDREEERITHLKQHIDSIRGHIKGLSDKHYATAKQLNTPEFVLLFMPIEAAFSAAMQHDHDLYSYAWDRQVVLVSPTTLLATLRTVASIWAQEKRTKNAEAIAEEAGKLYDKFVGFVDDMTEIGKRMDSSRRSYDDAMNKLTTGTGNLIRRAEHMKNLGARNTKNLKLNSKDDQDE